MLIKNYLKLYHTIIIHNKFIQYNLIIQLFHEDFFL